MRIGTAGLEFAVALAVERVLEIWLPFGEFFGTEHLGDVTAEVGCDGEIVYLGEPLVDADVAEVAIEKAEADGDTVVDGVELGEALGGESFKAERLGGVGGGAWRGGLGRMEAFGESFGELLGWDGAAVEPALAYVAAQPEEHVGDILRFDAFGDGGEAKAVAEADDGGGDLSALPGVGHGADEAGVDLEFVEGEELEVAEAGVTGSEVVEGETGALLLQFGRYAGGVLGVVDEGALGDLEDETVEREFCVFGGSQDMAGETKVGQLGEGDVDREGQVIGDVFGCGEDGAEEFAGEEAVEAGFFGEGNELVWGDEAALRMLPAGEGFEAAEKAGAKLYEWLKVRNDLVAFECSTQIICVISSHGRDDTTAATT
jgi:hypothetical protein